MRRTDIPFSGDDAHAFLPWVIGIMACMATLLLFLGLSVGGWIIDRGESYSSSFTVNIPSSENNKDKIQQVTRILIDMEGITDVRQVEEKHLREMLKPWLGNSDAVDALPLPVVLDVTVDEAVKIDYAAVQTKLVGIIPNTEVDAHERWIASFSDFSRAVRALLTGLATLIIGGLALMIAFMSRASLKLHSRTVNLLHSIGAEDHYITRQFQYEAFLLTLRGTVPGCLAAGLFYWASSSYMGSLQSSMLPPFILTGPHIALLIFMPLACGGVAWIAARMSVIRQLRRVL